MIKRAVQESLAMLGLHVYRTPRHLRRGRVTHLQVQVGKFQILMPSNSLLPDLFRTIPNYSTGLGRLVAAALKKYPNLQLLDIGANVGDSVAIVKSVADVPILCIEGDELCLALLEQNTRQFKDISIHKLFLGERTESIAAVFEKQGWNTTIVPSQNGSSTSLRLMSLDDFLTSLEDLQNFKVLKIDTEGFDCRIIRGGLDYIRKIRPVINFEYNRDSMGRIGESGIGTLSLLKEIGYDTILYYDSYGRLVLCTSLRNDGLISDLHEYANGKDGGIYYYDLCLFHRDDGDIALAFQESERRHLRQ
jgi:FkbM family methyltransferase